MERAELYLCVLRQLVLTCCDKIQPTTFLKLIKHSLAVLQEPTQQVTPSNAFDSFSDRQLGCSTMAACCCCQVPSGPNQVTRAVSMASLAAVCGLMEEEGIGIKSDILSALKPLNHYFYTSTKSPECPSSLGNINKCLIKPQLTDGSRLVEIYVID